MGPTTLGKKPTLVKGSNAFFDPKNFWLILIQVWTWRCSRAGRWVAGDQCDYIICHYLDTYNSSKLPKIYQKIAKVGSKFCQTKYRPSKVCLNFLMFTQVAKFRQIWSHWRRFQYSSESMIRKTKFSQSIISGYFRDHDLGSAKTHSSAVNKGSRIWKDALKNTFSKQIVPLFFIRPKCVPI